MYVQDYKPINALHKTNNTIDTINYDGIYNFILYVMY